MFAVVVGPTHANFYFTFIYPVFEFTTFLASLLLLAFSTLVGVLCSSCLLCRSYCCRILFSLLLSLAVAIESLL
jgi:hypothetical protein